MPFSAFDGPNGSVSAAPGAIAKSVAVAAAVNETNSTFETWVFWTVNQPANWPAAMIAADVVPTVPLMLTPVVVPPEPDGADVTYTGTGLVALAACALPPASRVIGTTPGTGREGVPVTGNSACEVIRHLPLIDLAAR